jgi:hypothetical protein
MTKTISLAVLALGVAFSAAAAEAPATNSTLTEVRGRLSVNQGDEFAPAVEGMRLKAGDRVMAQATGEGEIKFDDGCELEVEENTIVTVPNEPECKAALVQHLNPGGGAAIGATGNGGVGLMVAIVAAIDIWWLNEDDDDTVSP